jgi:hypothetical protein
MNVATYADYPVFVAPMEIVRSTAATGRTSSDSDTTPIERSFAGAPIWGFELAAGTKATRVTSISDDAPIFLNAVQESDRLVAEIFALQSLRAGWDGELAEEPNEAAIQDARRFVRAAGDIAANLEPTLHADGSVILEVGDGAEGSLRFKGDGTVIFATETDRGVLEFSEFGIPERVRQVLSQSE